MSSAHRCENLRFTRLPVAEITLDNRPRIVDRWSMSRQESGQGPAPRSVSMTRDTLEDFHRARQESPRCQGPSRGRPQRRSGCRDPKEPHGPERDRECGSPPTPHRRARNLIAVGEACATPPGYSASRSGQGILKNLAPGQRVAMASAPDAWSRMTVRHDDGGRAAPVALQRPRQFVEMTFVARAGVDQQRRGTTDKISVVARTGIRSRIVCMNEGDEHGSETVSQAHGDMRIPIVLSEKVGILPHDDGSRHRRAPVRAPCLRVLHSHPRTVTVVTLGSVERNAPIGIDGVGRTTDKCVCQSAIGRKRE